jgi:uncharacterized protein (TIRG00374 family)
MKIGWRGALGVAISVTLLWWTLRGESLSEVWAVLSGSNVGLFALSAITATLTFPMRAARWRYILEPAAGTIPFGPLWRATAIGMMVNNVAVARAGEPVRAFVLARSTGRVTFTAALASLVVDRVFDAVIVLLLLLVVVSLPGFPSGAAVMGWPVDRVLLTGAVIALVAVLGLAVVAVFPQRMVRIWDAVFGRIAPRFAERGRGILLSFGEGLGVLKDWRRSAIVFAWALAQWLVNGVSFWIAFLAVGLNAPFSAALFLQSLLAGAVAVPSAPGFFGPFEAATKVALGVYGIDDTFAVSYALGYHLLSFIPITVLGFWYLGRLGLHLKDLGRGPEVASQPATEGHQA